MAAKTIAPYGSWKSLITSELIVSQTVGVGAPKFDGDDVYWLEMRPTEGGRYVVVRRGADGGTSDVTPAPWNARTRVHEYGGGSYAVDAGEVFFANYADQRLYRVTRNGAPEPLTPEGALRYADFIVDRARSRLISVLEDHTHAAPYPANSLCAVPLAGGAPRPLASGCDFYSTPRLSPDGGSLAWLCWNHPDMPWDSTELWLAAVGGDGALRDARRVAGGEGESIFQPEWSPDGVLHFVSDRTGWWNIYRFRAGRVEPLCEMEAEFGAPQWVFGMRTYAFETPERLLCASTSQGVWRLSRLFAGQHRLEPLSLPYTHVSSVEVSGGRALFAAASPSEATAIVMMNLADARAAVLKRSNTTPVDAAWISQPEAVEFRTEHGLVAHALFYPPRNPDYEAPQEEKPPLLVHIHGGPTSAASSALSLSTQYWTSRGIGVIDVNYGGSSGYGRAYRKRLHGTWGIVDVDDCVNAALHLVRLGRADAGRLAIAGGSAGGYTTLAALAFRNVFHAGASHFGVSDAEALARDTHKFESRYLDRLIAPYPQGRDVYVRRSPVHFPERLSCPVIFFQGLEDAIVPPDQAEKMVAALRERGMPVAYVAFEGEQHGFRKARNIRRALDAEFYFYSRIFGFEPAEKIEPVEIEHEEKLGCSRG